MVLRALPRILHEMPDVKYRIVGDGPERTRLLRLAEELDVRRSVDFAGPVDDVALMDYYRTCDIFVMPSREATDGSDIEGFGIVFLEANLFGKPVIAGRSGGILDAVVDGQTGLIVDPMNIDEIADSVLTLFKDPVFARQLGQQGRERALRDFTYERIARQAALIMST